MEKMQDKCFKTKRGASFQGTCGWTDLWFLGTKERLCHGTEYWCMTRALRSKETTWGTSSCLCCWLFRGGEAGEKTRNMGRGLWGSPLSWQSREPCFLVGGEHISNSSLSLEYPFTSISPLLCEFFTDADETVHKNASWTCLNYMINC